MATIDSAINPAGSPLALAASQFTVGSLFRARATAMPDNTALQHGDRKLSYAALNDRVNRLVHTLAARGIGRGDRVAILSENRPEYLEFGLAAGKLGAILACQNWRQADAELTHCIGLVQPKLVVASERHLDKLERIGPDAPVLMLGEEYEHALAGADANEPPDVTHPEDGFVILYTSGSTGLPKGALISHRAMIARDMINRLDRPVDSDSAHVAWGPLFHMGGSEMSYASFMRGTKVIVMDGFDAAGLVDIAGREKLGWLTVMPGVQDRLLAEFQKTGTKVKDTRYIGVMADLMPRHVLAELTGIFGASYVNTFGATESGSMPFSRGLIPPGVVPERLSKWQSSLCQVRLVDENDQDVPDGEPGEAILRGPSLFSGYWANPEANAEDFRGGWFHLGDMFVRNPDGSVDFVDRRKYLIKSGGENIYPAEVERVLLADQRVADAIVVRRPDDKWGEVPVAFVVQRDEALTADEVIAACRGKIAGYKVPKEVRFVAASDLPRNASGKIVRYELEKRVLAQPAAG